MNNNIHKFTSIVFRLFFILLIVFSIDSFSQTSDTKLPWDNQLYIGNKVATGKNNWRYSGEIQVRLKNNTQNLDNYFVEGVASYLISKKWEVVPDFRISIKPDEIEYRPGFGVVNKLLFDKLQLVNQIKWQLDFDTKGNIENGLRYAIFVNYLIHDKYIPNFAVGAFYKWKDGFNGVQFVRFGPGLAYVIDVKHIVNFNYLLSVKNTGEVWNWAGIPVIQLVMNINKEYKYVPAKYFNF